MIRSFVLAIVTVIAVAGAGPVSRLAAQGPSAAKRIAPIPVAITGGASGSVVEAFLNEGKVADVPIGAAGNASWVLDMGNMGKSKVQIYVDVCEDNKVERVLFTTGGMPPEDEDCDRKPVGAGFWNDCGATKITLDLTRFGADVKGCGNFLTSPTGIATLGAIVVGGVAVTKSGGGTTSSSSTSSPPGATNPVTNNPVTTNPGTTNPPAPPTAPAAPFDFTVAITTSYTHLGSTSLACGLITTNPPLNQTATYSGTITGPGVVSGGSFSGSLNAAGWAAVEAVINLIGSYNIAGSVVAQGVTRSFSGAISVVSASSTCIGAPR